MPSARLEAEETLPPFFIPTAGAAPRLFIVPKKFEGAEGAPVMLVVVVVLYGASLMFCNVCGLYGPLALAPKPLATPAGTGTLAMALDAKPSEGGKLERGKESGAIGNLPARDGRTGMMTPLN